MFQTRSHSDGGSRALTLFNVANGKLNNDINTYKTTDTRSCRWQHPLRFQVHDFATESVETIQESVVTPTVDPPRSTVALTRSW
eukprot:1690160-Pyramimonas_sp.AAC.1